MAAATGLMNLGTQAHRELSRLCRSQASRCPAMPPASSAGCSRRGHRCYQTVTAKCLALTLT
jgi:hypothetical protein